MSDRRFAATASEEAEKINSEAGPGPIGMTLVTDQEFWEKQGISTGEELAKSILGQTYSDVFKEIHGTRPRHMNMSAMSVDDINNAITDLDMANSQEGEEDLTVSDVEPDDDLDEFETLPRQTGMGRKMENKRMSITKSQLITMVKEEIENLKNEGWLSGLFGGGQEEEPAAPADTSPDVPALDLTPEDRQEAEDLGFADPYDDSARRYSGFRRYKEWVDMGRPVDQFGKPTMSLKESKKNVE